MLFIIGIVFLIFAFCVIVYQTPKNGNVVESILEQGDRYIDRIIIPKKDDDSISEVTKQRMIEPIVFTKGELECPKSLGTDVGGKNERRCRDILKKIYGVDFPTVRPNWLKNPATGRNLELDCYNHQLKISCEYDGAQHRKAMRGQTQKDLRYQMLRDQFKTNMCKKLGITLIRVPDWLLPTQFEEYITRKLKEAGVYPKENNK